MKNKSFQDKVKEHMEKYAESNDELKGRIGGNWRGNPEPHIIKDKDKWYLNLFEQYRDEIVKYMRDNRIKKHTYAHHLTSSQMMCFNFFYPLLKNNLLSLILKQIDSSIDWGKPQGEFEFLSKLERNQEQVLKNVEDYKGLEGVSNIDFHVTTNKGFQVYFEIKYTENSFDKFGDKNQDFPKYMRKVNYLYRPLWENSIISLKEDEYFVKHYQVMRNLVQCENNKTYVVFLLPEQNKRVWNEATIVKQELKIDKHCSILDWSDLTEQIKKESKLTEYYNRFEGKYLNFLHSN